MSDTPETDAVWADRSQNILEHARRMELERNKWCDMYSIAAQYMRARDRVGNIDAVYDTETKEGNQTMDEETQNFRESSEMLGRIAAWVSDFFENEHTTTEEAVVLLLARYYQLKSNSAYGALEKMQEDRNSPTNKPEKQ